MRFAAAIRGPLRWEDPDEIDVGRKPVGHCALRHRVHACLGQMVARLEREWPCKALARRMGAWSLVGTSVKRTNTGLGSRASPPVQILAEAVCAQKKRPGFLRAFR